MIDRCCDRATGIRRSVPLVAWKNREPDLEVPPASHTTAHESAVTVAPFRAWRGSRLVIARGPARDTIEHDAILHCVTARHYGESGLLNQAKRF